MGGDRKRTQTPPSLCFFGDIQSEWARGITNTQTTQQRDGEREEREGGEKKRKEEKEVFSHH